jgi:cell division protein FtsB
MPHFETPLTQTLFYTLSAVAAAVLLYLGYRVGRFFGTASASKLITSKEQELFTAQRSFKQLYEQELEQVRRKNMTLEEKLKQMEAKVEEYRKKAAGFGGLFSSGGKRADAMYALLLENEALEEALLSQNQKLQQERTDALKEQIRSTGYRRVLMSQLLNDERIKSYISEIMADDKRLPQPHPPSNNAQALPDRTGDEQ